MSEINLLPKKEKSSKQNQKAVTFLTRIAIVAGSVVIFGALVAGGILFFVNRDYQSAQAEYDSLFARVKELEATEFSLLLVKERLGKIAPYLATRNQFNSLQKYSEIVATLPANTVFKGMNLSQDTSKLTVGSSDSDSLSSVIKSLSDSGKYAFSLIDKLKFSDIQGFELSITAN